MLVAAIVVNLACAALVAWMASRRRLGDDQPIGAGGWALLTVLFGPITLALFLLAVRRR